MDADDVVTRRWTRGLQRAGVRRRVTPRDLSGEQSELAGAGSNRHPHGYVRNTTRTPTTKYVVLHRASCRTIGGCHVVEVDAQVLLGREPDGVVASTTSEEYQPSEGTFEQPGVDLG
jgi:hypothetical protein